MESTNNKRRTLFLWLDDKQFHSVNAQRRGVDTARVYKNIPDILKIIRRIHIKINLFPISIWLESWKRNLHKYDTIIIHASILTSIVVKYLNKKDPNLRIIVWYWNPISKSEKLEKFSESLCEVWTFDIHDAKKYNLKYNSQYYFHDIILEKSKETEKILFVGGDKGRYDMLIELQNELSRFNILTDFHITQTSKSTNSNKYKKRISYNSILKKIAESTAILDIVSEGQSGLTLRPLEALFFEKKLITNDKSMIEWDCYHPNNIFILGIDNLSNLHKFMGSDFYIFPDQKKMYYDFDMWLNRFFE